MKCNPKYFDLGNTVEPFETQEFDGRRIDLYYMNDFDNTFDQSLAQGRFAMWTSVDGKNYHLYLEHGFHDEMKSLYSANVNKIWLDYWDRVDSFTKGINFKFLLPLCVVIIVTLVLISMLLKDNTKLATIIQIVFAALFIIGMFMVSGYQKRQALTFHNEAMENIKQEVGVNHFDGLIDRQGKYINNYLEERSRQLEAQYRAEHPEDFLDENESLESDEATLVNPQVEEVSETVIEEDENLFVEEIKEEKELDQNGSNE